MCAIIYKWSWLDYNNLCIYIFSKLQKRANMNMSVFSLKKRAKPNTSISGLRKKGKYKYNFFCWEMRNWIQIFVTHYLVYFKKDSYIAVVSTMYLARPHIVYIVYCIVYSLHFQLHKPNCGSTLKILEKDRERLI